MVELMSSTTPAHRRLIFEELFYLELGFELKRRRMRERVGTAFTTGPAVREAIKQVLPFHHRRRTKRVLGEIVADMRKPQPMRRPVAGRRRLGQDHRRYAGRTRRHRKRRAGRT